jgi:HlyD family secretion protein
MKTRILVLVGILLAVGAYFAWTRTRGEDPNLLRLSGNIEFLKMDIAFKTAGRLVDLRVDEGANVTKGMLLAGLDTEQLEQMRGRDAAGVAMANSNLEQMRTAIRFQKEAVASETVLRENEIRQAKAKLQELLDGARPQEIQQAQAAVADLDSQRRQAQVDFERGQKLISREDISQSQFDQLRVRLDSLTAQLRIAQERLALLREGPRKTDIEAARAAVGRAEASLRMTEAQRLDILRKEQDLSARLADIERAKAGLGIVETQLSDAQVQSPIDGVVMVKSADPGEVLAAGSAILTLGDIDHPWLRAYVPQQRLGRIKLGMPVKIFSDSYPGKIYNGRISFIASEAEFTPKQIQTDEERVKLVYRIKVEVENPNRELKLNMPVTAEIQL